METSSLVVRLHETPTAGDPHGIGMMESTLTRIESPAVAANRSATPFYTPIATSLVNVERRLQSELQSRYESIAPLLRHGVQLGGKRLRPALVLLSGAAIDPNAINDQHEILAAVLEMVHTATLIHDDVLDQASSRRHVPTINADWGDHASILLGDYLFSQAFRMSAATGSTIACEWIGEAARRVCEGELRQVLARDQMDLDQASYIEMIRGKTAELCSVACRLGASFSGGNDAEINSLYQYGDALGIAFQIADDYLDIWGDAATVGKTLGTDLEQGKWTLPILRMRETASPSARRKIDAALMGGPEHRLRSILPMLDASDARQYTRDTAIGYRDAACAALGDLKDTSAKNSLLELATFAVDRTF